MTPLPFCEDRPYYRGDAKTIVTAQASPGRARRWLAIALLPILVLAAAGIPTWRLWHTAMPVKIAFANTLSGPLASSGLDVRNGVQLYLDTINGEGGVTATRSSLSHSTTKPLPKSGSPASRRSPTATASPCSPTR